MALYQLELKQGVHENFVYFDNGTRNADAFVVCVSIRRLRGEEHARTADAIRSVCGAQALGRRTHNVLEFMKYCSVWTGQHRAALVDMDNLCDVDLGAVTERTLLEASCATSATSTDKQVKHIHGVAPAHRHERADCTRTMRFATQSHGMVTVELSTYANPDVRNGIQIRCERPVTVDNAYGALVKAVNPKFIRTKKMNALPKAAKTPPRTINASQYYIMTEGTFENEGETERMLIPSGGAGKKFRVPID